MRPVLAALLLGGALGDVVIGMVEEFLEGTERLQSLTAAAVG